MSMGDTLASSFAIAATIELGLHILIHYTVPGAALGSWLAQTLAPALDAVGLTSIFSASAAAATGEQVVASVGEAAASPAIGSLPSLSALAQG